MKKIISFLVFTAALIWTWNLIHSTAAIGFETHSGIQKEMAKLIAGTLAKYKPEAKDFNIKRLWTEPLGDNKVRVVFAYSYTEQNSEQGASEQTVEGEAILHRGLSDSQDIDKWDLQSVKTTNDAVVFSEGSLVTPKTEDSNSVDNTTENPAPTSPEAKSKSSESTH